VTRPLESLLGLAPEAGAGWLGALRRDALAAFESQGLPTRRLEAWKGTDYSALGELDFVRVGPDAAVRVGPDAAVRVGPDPAVRVGGDAARATATGSGDAELVFVDGRLDAEASSPGELPRGVRVMSLADAIANEPALVEGRLGSLPDTKRESLVALQTALFEDGAVVALDAEARMERPLRMRLVSTTSEAGASAAFPRLLVVAGERSEATLLLEHESAGEGPGFTALVAELLLAAGARCELVQVQAEEGGRIHFTSVHARLERDARFESHVFSLGRGLVRSEMDVTLAEPGAETVLRGLFLGRDHSHIDHYTTVDHAAESCTSDEEYRGVLADRSKGVFRGRVIIRPAAQKTDARQSNPNLLLSDDATIDAKPQLEIYADDVRASHGSTIGQLDADALFFLRSRGLGEAEARLLLTNAFAERVVETVRDVDLRARVADRLVAALAAVEAQARDRAALAAGEASAAGETARPDARDAGRENPR
jgi:Fe-S cluster assembly protein SufD